MGKDVNFNIKLRIDGKDIVASASTSVKELADNLKIVQKNSSIAEKKFMRWSQSVMALNSINS